MKKMINALRVTSFVIIFFSAGNVNAATVDLNAFTGNVESLDLSAGTYEVTPVDDPFEAWNAWSTGGAVRGCDANGENCNQGFIHQYTISFGGTSTLVANGGRYETAELAFNNASSFVFSLAADQIVSFQIVDINYGDNSGGVSLNVSAVPIPAAAWLFGSALVGLASMRRRRAG